MPVQARVHVHLFWDDETARWDYRVPQLHVVGGGGPAREDALRRAADAVAFTLEGADERLEPGEGIVVYLPITIGI